MKIELPMMAKNNETARGLDKIFILTSCMVPQPAINIVEGSPIAIPTTLTHFLSIIFFSPFFDYIANLISSERYLDLGSH